MSARCPHCGGVLSSYVVRTTGHSFPSYWCQKHGDVVPMGDEYGEREQGEVPDLQDDIQHPVDSRDWRCESVLPEPKVSSEA